MFLYDYKKKDNELMKMGLDWIYRSRRHCQQDVLLVSEVNACSSKASHIHFYSAECFR